MLLYEEDRYSKMKIESGEMVNSEVKKKTKAIILKLKNKGGLLLNNQPKIKNHSENLGIRERTS